jgi:hypothetical protein
MSETHMRHLWRFLLVSALFTLVWTFGQVAAQAQEPVIEENEACLTCHINPDLVVEFPDGSTRSGRVSSDAYAASVHGQQEMTCGGCHPDHEEYPHPEVDVSSTRDYTLALNETCVNCHPEQAEQASDSTHSRALEAGHPEAAVCVDCHGAHDVQSMHNARVEIATTCRQCHAQIYDEFASSIHGSALVEENNTDVPTCVDCHGVHNIDSPHTTEFRLESPTLCGGCHANEALMSKYDISTDVFETYVADFHGSTVTLFEKQSPDAATNKAVCYDCHGVHAILPMDDPDAIANNKENLLETCQKCHPDATINFPDSWTSHYQPTFEKQPLVAAINMFYLLVIPATIGGMAMFVMTDAGRRVLGRGHHRTESDEAADEPAASTSTEQTAEDSEEQSA